MHGCVCVGPRFQDTEDHLQAEEQQLLPGLVQALRQEQLMALGRVFEWAKLIAPSRYAPASSCCCAGCSAATLGFSCSAVHTRLAVAGGLQQRRRGTTA